MKDDKKDRILQAAEYFLQNIASPNFAMGYKISEYGCPDTG